MAKESTLEKNVESLIEGMNFVVGNMLTKDDVRQIIEEEVHPRLDRVELQLGKVESRLDKVEIKLDKVDTKLAKFVESEIDKRKQLEVRVTGHERKA